MDNICLGLGVSASQHHTKLLKCVFHLVVLVFLRDPRNDKPYTHSNNTGLRKKGKKQNRV